MHTPDHMNEPMIAVMNPQHTSLTDIIKISLTCSGLTSKEMIFVNAILDNTSIIVDIGQFLHDKGAFSLHHIPEFVVFITGKMSLDKPTQINLLECVKLVVQSVLSSNAVPLTATEHALLANVLNASITLLETNLHRPNSRGCCFWC